jgi:hypothetical protein
VSHAPHSGHFPIHLGACPPQDWHLNVNRSFLVNCIFPFLFMVHKVFNYIILPSPYQDPEMDDRYGFFLLFYFLSPNYIFFRPRLIRIKNGLYG